MKAFIIETQIKIEPFGDLARDSLILDKPLHSFQKSIFDEIGIEVQYLKNYEEIPETAGPCLVLHDNLLFSRSLVRDFLQKISESSGQTTQLWVKKGLFTRLLAVVQETPEDSEKISFPLWFVATGRFSPNDSRMAIVDVDEDSYEGNFPFHMIKKESYRFCVTSRPVLVVHHPLHIALGNFAANFARLAEMKKMSLWQKIKTVLKARSINKFRILSAVSKIHPEAEVHPTAVIEGSVIEKGAKIGAYSVVKFSYVGEKAFIDDHAGLKFSIVGREAYIANNCVLFFSVVYPRAFLISGPYQFSLFGYDSAMMNSIPSDYRLDGKTISVKTHKGVVDTGLRFVGSVIGHRSKIAAGIIVAPGRVIPNDLLIFPDPARVIQKMPRDLGSSGSFFLINGQLEPVFPSKKGDRDE